LESEQVVCRTTLAVRQVGGDRHWQVIDRTGQCGLGYATPAIVRCSLDTGSLYFGNAPVPDGCAPFVTTEDLYRLDLETDSVTELLEPTRSLVIALSPDERTISFIEWRPGQGWSCGIFAPGRNDGGN
jgi:sugar lactone lactonase YvrE